MKTNQFLLGHFLFHFRDSLLCIYDQSEELKEVKAEYGNYRFTAVVDVWSSQWFYKVVRRTFLLRGGQLDVSSSLLSVVSSTATLWQKKKRKNRSRPVSLVRVREMEAFFLLPLTSRLYRTREEERQRDGGGTAGGWGLLRRTGDGKSKSNKRTFSSLWKRFFFFTSQMEFRSSRSLSPCGPAVRLKCKADSY